MFTSDGQYNLAALELNAAKELGADVREVAMALRQRSAHARIPSLARMKSADFQYRRPSLSLNSDFDSMRAWRDVDAVPGAL